MGLYVPASWLQAIHYYYFCMGIFSFTGGVVFGAFPNYAALFIVSYVLNSAVCWYLSWWMHKKVKRNIILNYRRYFLNHTILAIASVGAMTLMIYITMSSPGAPAIPEFMDFVIGFNFFTFSSAFIWSVALKLDIINRAFSTYNMMSLKNAREFAIKTRGTLKTGVLVPVDRFRSYKPGSDDRIDSMLMEVWESRKKPGLKISVMKLEIAMCDNVVSEMLARVQELERLKNSSASDATMVSSYKKLIDKYAKDSFEYEKRVANEEARSQ